MEKLEKITKHFPGMRIIKTVLALLICFLIYYFLDEPVAMQAVIAAIVCMQPGMSTTLVASANRAIGTVVSGVYAYFLIRFATEIAHHIPGTLSYNALVAVAVIPLMSVLVSIKKPGSVVIATIVYIMISLPYGPKDPLGYTITRVAETLVGIAAAVFVQWFPPLNKLGNMYTEFMHIEVPEDIAKEHESRKKNT